MNAGEPDKDEGLFSPVDVAKKATDLWNTQIRPKHYPPGPNDKPTKLPDSVEEDLINGTWEKIMKIARTPPNSGREK